LNEFGNAGRYLNCEILSVEQNLQEAEPEKLKAYLGNYKLVVLDEAQNIRDIGKILKLITDSLPGIQIIATGSSSFDLANKTAEPMTGRAYSYILYPLSSVEISQYSDWFTFDAKLDGLLRFGAYPEIFLSDESTAVEKLNNLSTGYLYKDLLKFEGIKKSSLLNKLLISLALQSGNEVSYHELATKLGVTAVTVQKYIDLLEQCYVVFKINSFSRNIRKELTKAFKVYFYDLGIRNAIIQNFNPLSLRIDIGSLWGNFCIIERMKSNQYNNRRVNGYFWRTYDQKEIDYIEEVHGKITGYEFKFSETKKFKPNKDFMVTYNAEIHKIDKSNFWKFAELKI